MKKIRHIKQLTQNYGVTIVYMPTPVISENTAYFNLVSGLSFRKISVDTFSRKCGRSNASANFEKSPVQIKNYPGEKLEDSIFRWLKNKAYECGILTKNGVIFKPTKDGHYVIPKQGDVPPKLLIEIAQACAKSKRN